MNKNQDPGPLECGQCCRNEMDHPAIEFTESPNRAFCNDCILSQQVVDDTLMLLVAAEEA